MPIQIDNLQYTLFRADAAQAMQSLFITGDRAMQAAQATQTQDIAKAAQVEVQETQKVEGSVIQDGGGGSAGSYEGSTPDGTPEKEPKEEKIESPDGKGRIVDLQA
jgi:hypothetical protein